jgi:hypothetical protein
LLEAEEVSNLSNEYTDEENLPLILNPWGKTDIDIKQQMRSKSFFIFVDSVIL